MHDKPFTSGDPWFLQRATLCLLLILGGCTPYFEANSALLTQTRRGIERVEESINGKAQIVRAYHALQRDRLNEAFDQDVRERAALTPDWVVEHRRAYSAALAELTRAEEASSEAAESDRRTLAAMRAAVDRLEWLQSIPRSVSHPGGQDE